MFFVCRFSCFVLVSISLCNQSYIHRQGLMFINVSGCLTVVDVCVCVRVRFNCGFCLFRMCCFVLFVVGVY